MYRNFQLLFKCEAILIYNLNYLLCYEDKNVKKMCSLIKKHLVPKKVFFISQTDGHTLQFFFKKLYKILENRSKKQTNAISNSGLYPSKVDSKLKNHHPEAPLKHAKNGQLFFATIPKMMMVVVVALVRIPTFLNRCSAN